MSVLGRIWSQAKRSMRIPVARSGDFSPFIAQALVIEETADAAAALALLQGMRSVAAASPEAYWRLGRTLGRAGDLEHAREALEAARGLDPALGDVDADLGNVEALGGRLEEADQCYRAALARHPGHPEMLANLGQLLRVKREPLAARAIFAQALDSDPECAPALKGFAAVGFGGEDLERVAHIAAAAPECAAAHAAYATLLHRVPLDAERALEHFERARALGLDDGEVHGGRGLVLRELGRVDEALGALDTALVRDPGNAVWRWHRALLLLAQGRYTEGWADYEFRLRSEDRPQRSFGLPRWSGGGLAGRNLLVHAEQGLGDEIMFASCLPEVSARAERCIVDCHPKLASLYRRSFPGVVVHAGPQLNDSSWLAALGGADCQVPVGSLPLYLRRNMSDFPQRRYLLADSSRVQRWRSRLAALGSRHVIGVSWQGGTRESRRAQRTVGLEGLRPLLATQGIHWISLQYDATAAEVEAFAAAARVKLSHWSQVVEDFDETAALLCALDLTISVCTAVVHLAGALGCPVWVLTPHAPEWRYGLSGDAMAWYDSVRLFRKLPGEDWTRTVGRMREALDAWQPA